MGRRQHSQKPGEEGGYETLARTHRGSAGAGMYTHRVHQYTHGAGTGGMTGGLRAGDIRGIRTADGDRPRIGSRQLCRAVASRLDPVRVWPRSVIDIVRPSARESRRLWASYTHAYTMAYTV